MSQPLQLIQLRCRGVDGGEVRNRAFEEQPTVHQPVHCMGFGWRRSELFKDVLRRLVGDEGSAAAPPTADNDPLVGQAR